MNKVRRRRARVFRVGFQTFPSALFFAIVGLAGVFGYYVYWGIYEAAVFPGLAAIAGLGMVVKFLLRRVEVDHEGIRVFNGFGTRIGGYAWEQVQLYQPLTSALDRTTWVIGASGNDQIELPGVDDPYGLQQAIIPNLPVGAIQPAMRSGRPLKSPPVDEIHEKRYRPSNDIARLTVRTVLLAMLGAAILFLAYEVVIGHLTGFMIGVVILAALWSFREIFASFRAYVPGRRIEMTADHLVVTEDGREKKIAWRDLRLVERRYLPNPERQANYVLLYDGQTSIAYREDWRHTDALLRYASNKAPSETVFTGFDAPPGPRL